MLSTLLSTFGIVFLAELPDKTALAVLVLATRYGARQVIAGAWLAFIVQTGVGVAAGSVLTLLPAPSRSCGCRRWLSRVRRAGTEPQ